MARTPITAYPNFNGLRYAYTTGTAVGGPTWSPIVGDGTSAPLLFSVTQEDPDGNHDTSKNWIGPDADYMADYAYPDDLGTWLTMDVANGVVTLVENIGAGTNSVTGWPLAYGHTFVGFNDLSIIPGATLNHNIALEFDIKVFQLPPAPAPGAPFVGARVLVGGLINWKEADGRKNTAHYFEIDLAQTPGYGPSLGSFAGLPLCGDEPYDSCFYDPDGNYAEGRYVSLEFTGNPSLPLGQWTHLALDYGSVCKVLGWVAPPSSWSMATVSGLYVAVEGIGAQQTHIKVRNWNPSMRA